MKTNTSLPHGRSLKIVVIGGTGLIGTKVTVKLREAGHDVIPASPSTGINTLTGEGLDEAFAGAQVVVDVANSPSFEDEAVIHFFRTATENITRAAEAAGVKHLVALSVVGTDRLQQSGYFRAKLIQEEIIRQGHTPHTIVRATQFFEFIGAIAHGMTQGQTVRVTPALFQPIAAEDVADAMVDAALAEPVQGMIEVAGPELISLADAVRRHLAHLGDSREVIADPEAGYFGLKIDDRSLNTDAGARIGLTNLSQWLGANASAA